MSDMQFQYMYSTCNLEFPISRQSKDSSKLNHVVMRRHRDIIYNLHTRLSTSACSGNSKSEIESSVVGEVTRCSYWDNSQQY